MREVDRNAFGDPPPRYPAKVKAVRKFGVVVTGEDAIGRAQDLRFDLVMRTIDGDLMLEGVVSYSPTPANDVDVDARNLVGAVVDVWFIPEENALLPMVPLLAASEDCENIQ